MPMTIVEHTLIFVGTRVIEAIQNLSLDPRDNWDKPRKPTFK